LTSEQELNRTNAKILLTTNLNQMKTNRSKRDERRSNGIWTYLRLTVPQTFFKYENSLNYSI